MFHSIYAAIERVLTNARDRYYAQLRRFDLDMLWSTCCEEANGNLDAAKAAFAVHAFHDYAWKVLGHAEIYKIIDQLQCPQYQQHPPSIKCPNCGRVSYNPNDIKNRYCGNCNLFHNTL